MLQLTPGGLLKGLLVSFLLGVLVGLCTARLTWGAKVDRELVGKVGAGMHRVGDWLKGAGDELAPARRADPEGEPNDQESDDPD